MKAKMADYVLSLKDAADSTHHAEDRSRYLSLIADAGVILALLVTGADQKTIEKSIEKHERLWGQTWLQDEVFQKPLSEWQVVKNSDLRLENHPLTTASS